MRGDAALLAAWALAGSFELPRTRRYEADHELFRGRFRHNREAKQVAFKKRVARRRAANKRARRARKDQR